MLYSFKNNGGVLMANVKVGIVGLGLMGGSLSLALKKLPQDYYFIGFDHNEVHCTQALKLDLVDEISSSLETLKTCDIIFLSYPC